MAGGGGGYVFKFIWENLNPVYVGVLLVLLSYAVEEGGKG